jgi:hypothetical protein
MKRSITVVYLGRVDQERMAEIDVTGMASGYGERTVGRVELSGLVHGLAQRQSVPASVASCDEERWHVEV